MTETPGEQVQADQEASEEQSAADRAQEAAAPLETDETGTPVAPTADGDQGEPQPA